MSNMPCDGCFWIEGGKCYQDKLAFVHGLGKAPRGNLVPGAPSGLEITDALITACVERGGHASKNAIYGRFKRQLREAGIEVVSVSLSSKEPAR